MGGWWDSVSNVTLKLPVYIRESLKGVCKTPAISTYESEAAFCISVLCNKIAVVKEALVFILYSCYLHTAHVAERSSNYFSGVMKTSLAGELTSPLPDSQSGF